MKTLDFQPEQLEQIWAQMLHDTFVTFSIEHLGAEESRPPKCYDTGDGQTYCEVCPWRPTC